MIIIENTHVDNVVRAVYSARNAMNSWNRSDSDWNADALGKNDLMLAKQLSKAGNDHAKFLRMINVTMDITAPLYWWKEFDTYKVGTVANSCSTMQKIHSKEFTLDDFSCEHIITNANEAGTELVDTAGFGTDILVTPKSLLNITIGCLNNYRKMYIETKNKKWWWQMIQLLPSSYNQKRTVQLNYAVLKNMYFARRNHKLDEWHTFCDAVLSLPYFETVCVNMGEAKE